MPLSIARPPFLCSPPCPFKRALPPPQDFKPPPLSPRGELRSSATPASSPTRLTSPSSAPCCRTFLRTPKITGASPSPRNAAAHRCHRPPHHRPTASVSSRPHDLALRVARLAVVLTARTSSPRNRRRARPGRNTEMVVDAVTVLRAPRPHRVARSAKLKWPWARPTVPYPWAEAGPTLCGEFFDFFLFFVIFQKIGINFKNLWKTK
jgi:hypothetical protein